jgi:hypothetical protein
MTRERLGVEDDGRFLTVGSGEKSGNPMQKLGNEKKKSVRRRKNGEISLGKIKAGENHGINEDQDAGTKKLGLQNTERGLNSSFNGRTGMLFIPKSVKCSKIHGYGADSIGFLILL